MMDIMIFWMAGGHRLFPVCVDMLCYNNFDSQLPECEGKLLKPVSERPSVVIL